MAYGDSAGFNFQLPGTQGYSQGQGYLGVSQAEQEAQQANLAPATGQAVLPNIQQDIAQIEGITNEYYDSYGKLKSFVEDMNKKGVDVTKPDYSQPGGGVLFQTYKKLEAGIMNTANTLKNELAYRNKMAPLEAQGQIRRLDGIDPRTQTLSTQESYYSTDLFDEVKNFNDRMKNLYTRQDVDQFNIERDRLKTQLTGQLSNPNLSAPQKAQIENNIRALSMPVQTVNPYTLRPPTAAAQGVQDAKDAAFTYYTKLANVLQGVGSYQPMIDKDNKIVQMDNSFANIPIGDSPEINVKGNKVVYPKIIEGIVKKGDKTYIRYMQPDKLKANGKITDAEYDPRLKDLLPDEPITSAAKLLERIVKENKTALGFDTADVLAILKEKGYILGSGESDDVKAVTTENKPNVVKPIDENALVTSIAAFKKDLASNTSNEPFSEYVNGQSIKVRKNKPFFGEGTPFIGGKATYSILIDGFPLEGGTDLTLDQVPEVLRTKTAYFDNLLKLNTAPSSQPTQAPVNNEVVNRWAPKK